MRYKMTFQNITPQEAKKLIEEDGAILIDVREMDEFEQGHIPYAAFMPLSDFANTWNKVSYPENTKIIFQCAVGGRSAKACDFVAENDNKKYELYNLDGGYKLWAQEELVLI